MTGRTRPRAHNGPQKPHNPQNSRRTSADQHGSSPEAPAAGSPQKPAKAPQKYAPAAPARGDSRAAADLCGTSDPFCGTRPHHPNTAGQAVSSQVSADSAVSAAGVRTQQAERKDAVTLVVPEHTVPAAPVLYRVKDVMPVLRMGRTQIYDLIRTGRLRTVKEGRSRLIPASAINDYVALLEREAGEAA